MITPLLLALVSATSFANDMPRWACSYDFSSQHSVLRVYGEGVSKDSFVLSRSDECGVVTRDVRLESKNGVLAFTLHDHGGLNDMDCMTGVNADVYRGQVDLSAEQFSFDAPGLGSLSCKRQ